MNSNNYHFEIQVAKATNREKRTALRRRVLCDEKAINSENCIAIDSEKLSL